MKFLKNQNYPKRVEELVRTKFLTLRDEIEKKKTIKKPCKIKKIAIK